MIRWLLVFLAFLSFACAAFLWFALPNGTLPAILLAMVGIALLLVTWWYLQSAPRELPDYLKPFDVYLVKQSPT